MITPVITPHAAHHDIRFVDAEGNAVYSDLDGISRHLGLCMHRERWSLSKTQEFAGAYADLLTEIHTRRTLDALQAELAKTRAIVHALQNYEPLVAVSLFGEGWACGPHSIAYVPRSRA